MSVSIRTSQTRIARPRLRQNCACSVAAEDRGGASGRRRTAAVFQGFIVSFELQAASKVHVPNPVYLHRPPAASPLMLCSLSFCFCVCLVFSRISEAACSYYVRPACTIVPLQQMPTIQAGGKKKDIEKLKNFQNRFFRKATKVESLMRKRVHMNENVQPQE